ncbi:Ribosomal RNA small subunit methyltransferase E [uncultured Alphaproteobacteria bacterium]|uniref:Ribosomal RNA small subunit methyltransferase E n=1 Tax=uncultured Alphaproteobacteria bacterium TaxID=91750 RepID=A0A212K742_9PROT|nr:Ribosomal RNA small subunit methyltransferase E [uncultured Alphaproteobacteria bacterium]
MPRIASTAPRLYVPDALAEAADVPLAPAQAHYLRDVMRMAPGDAVRLFNGRDGAWLAEVAALGKGRGSLRVGACIAPQRPEPGVWLLFAPLKSARQDMLVEKAVELGVAVLQPVLTERTQTRRVNPERLAAQVTEAAEQCERLTLPEVRPLAELSDLLARWPAGRTLFYGDETGGGGAALAAFSAPAGVGGDALLVGPEGGFSPRELDVLRGASFSLGVGFGPRILRAETAAVVALSLWQATRGDGGLAPGRS